MPPDKFHSEGGLLPRQDFQLMKTSEEGADFGEKGGEHTVGGRGDVPSRSRCWLLRYHTLSKPPRPSVIPPSKLASQDRALWLPLRHALTPGSQGPSGAGTLTQRCAATVAGSKAEQDGALWGACPLPTLTEAAALSLRALGAGFSWFYKDS